MTSDLIGPDHDATPEARKLTDEEVTRAIRTVFARADQLRAVTLTLDPTPHPTSPLAGDNGKTSPYQLTHLVVQQLQVATEHLDALRMLVLDAGVLHPSAPFTIARGALEAGAAAVWLLAPSRREERVMRALSHVLRDATDGNIAATGMGLAPARPLEERRKQLEKLAEAATGGRTCRVKLERSTDIVAAADVATRSPVGVLSAWRVCSGFAHGRMWAWIAVLNHEELPGAPPGEYRLRVTSTLDRVLWAAWAATDVAERGLELFRRRAASWYPPELRDAPELLPYPLTRIPVEV